MQQDNNVVIPEGTFSLGVQLYVVLSKYINVDA